MKPDPYSTLGVSKTATQDEIKSAYRKLAKKYHPDFNPGKKEAEKKFKDISAAYELVGTPEQRAKFDRGEFNEPPPHSQHRGQGPFYYETHGPSGGGGHYWADDDIFDSFFGGKGRGSRGVNFKGQDISYQMEVDFRDAVLGAEREITLADGKRISVKIPPGIETGKKLRFQGLGESGVGSGSPGDAYVEVIVRDSPIFKRVGFDLESELLVTLAEAVLGAEVKVPTIDGSIMLKVPSGSNTGSKLRVKGKGVVQSSSNRGDLLVSLKVILPSKVDPELKEAIKIWSEKHPQELER